MADYISWIRRQVGHNNIILNFSGACVTDSEGRVLLQKRSKDEESWGFPGGAIELGESAAEAAVREVKEETGLDVSIDYLQGIYSKYHATYPNGDRAQTICIFFKCSVSSGALYADGIETFELRFFRRDSLPSLFNKQHQDMLDDFLQNKRGVY